MKREQTVDYNIKATWHAIARMYNQQAVKHDITTSIGFVLLNIDSQEGTPATKIAPLMGLESRSLTRMLRTMEEKGLIYRQQDENDRRSIRIFLTDQGKKKKEISWIVVKTFDRVIREEIPDHDLQVFFSVIQRINRIVEKNNIYDNNSKTIADS